MELMVVAILSLAGPLGGLIMAGLVYLLVLAGNLVFGLALGTQAKRAAARRWTLWITAGAAGLLVVLLAALAAANAFFFDSLTGWVFDRLDKKAGISLTFDRAEGCLWSGRFRFQGLEARRVDHPRNVFDFRVDSAEVDISMSDLVRRKIVFDRLEVAGVGGFFEQRAKAETGPGGSGKKGLRPSRSFVINNFDLTDVTVDYRDQTRARPLAAEFKLDHLRAEAVSSRTLAADLLFQSNAAGSFEGAAFSIVNDRSSAGLNRTAWNCDNLTVGALAALAGGPFDWFEDGRVDIRVDNQGQAGQGVTMDWNLLFRNFQARTPTEASPAVKVWAAPAVAYINNKSDDLNLGFTFRLSPGDLEFASTEDLKELVLKLVGESFKEQVSELGQKARTEAVRNIKDQARDRLEQKRADREAQAGRDEAGPDQAGGEISPDGEKKDGGLKSLWKDRKARKAKTQAE